jgi:hypothetical protein
VSCLCKMYGVGFRFFAYIRMDLALWMDGWSFSHFSGWSLAQRYQIIPLFQERRRCIQITIASVIRSITETLDIMR